MYFFHTRFQLTYFRLINGVLILSVNERIHEMGKGSCVVLLCQFSIWSAMDVDNQTHIDIIGDQISRKVAVNEQ
jgi:hypothetical protein